MRGFALEESDPQLAAWMYRGGRADDLGQQQQLWEQGGEQQLLSLCCTRLKLLIACSAPPVRNRTLQYHLQPHMHGILSVAAGALSASDATHAGSGVGTEAGAVGWVLKQLLWVVTRLLGAGFATILMGMMRAFSLAIMMIMSGVTTLTASSSSIKPAGMPEASAGDGTSGSEAPSSSSSAAGSARRSSRAAAGALASEAAAVLPWLALLGKACLYWSAQIDGAIARDKSSLLALVTTQRSVDCWLHPRNNESTKGVYGMLLRCLDGASSKLGASSIAVQFASAGYELQSCLQLLQEAATQLGLLLQPEGLLLQPEGLLAEFAQQLRKVGQALSNMPHSNACNNPTCVNLAGLSERQLVTGRTCRCSGCRVARYCSKACQSAHWKQHKPACKALVAAVQAAAK